METLDEINSCYICNRCGAGRRLTCQLHYMCAECLEKNEGYNNCLLCSPLTSSPPDSNPAPIDEAVADIRKCIYCKEKLLENDVQFCNDCNTTLCFNCAIRHKRDHHDSRMHEIQPFFSENIPNCPQHNTLAKYFCISKVCNILTCDYCRDEDHKLHNSSTIEKKAAEYRNEVLVFITSYSDKLRTVNSFIDRLHSRKNAIGEKTSILEEELIERKTRALQAINKEFDNQSEKLKEKRTDLMNEVSQEILELEKIKADLIKMRELSVHYSDKPMNYNVFRDYYVLKHVSDKNISNQSYYKAYTTLDFINTKLFDSSVSEIAAGVFGDIRTVVDEVAITKYAGCEEFAFQLSVLREFKEDEIKDICYDFEQKVVYLLRKVQSDYFLIQFKDNKWQEFRLNAEDCVGISVLADNEILLRCVDKFKSMMAINPCSLKDVSVPLCSASNVLAMCTTISRQFIFFYCKGGSVFKFDAVHHVSLGVSINLFRETVCMSVSQNLDYIVFTAGVRLIYLFSFNQGQMLQTFRPMNNSICKCATFLSNNIFVAMETSTHSLTIYHAENKEFIRKIKYIKAESCRKLQHYGKITSLTATDQNTIYIGFLDIRHRNKIYNVRLW